jgi:hypothetical protein
VTPGIVDAGDEESRRQPAERPRRALLATAVMLTLLVLGGFAYKIQAPTSSRMCAGHRSPDSRLHPTPAEAFEAWWTRSPHHDPPPGGSRRDPAPTRLTRSDFEVREESNTRVAYVWHYSDRSDWEVLMTKEVGGWLLTGASYCEDVSPT